MTTSRFFSNYLPSKVLCLTGMLLFYFLERYLDWRWEVFHPRLTMKNGWPSPMIMKCQCELLRVKLTWALLLCSFEGLKLPIPSVYKNRWQKMGGKRKEKCNLKHEFNSVAIFFFFGLWHHGLKPLVFFYFLGVEK